MNRKLLILVIVMALLGGGIGWAIQRTTRATPNQANAPQPTQSSQTKPQPATVTAQGDTTTPSAKAVQATYDAYIQSANSLSMQSPETNLDSIQPYLTDALYVQLKDLYARGDVQSDKVVCAQDVPSTVVAGSDAQTASKVIVTETFGTTTSNHSVTVDANNKISAISCVRP